MSGRVAGRIRPASATRADQAASSAATAVRIADELGARAIRSARLRDFLLAARQGDIGVVVRLAPDVLAVDYADLIGFAVLDIAHG